MIVITGRVTEKFMGEVSFELRLRDERDFTRLMRESSSSLRNAHRSRMKAHGA